MAITQTTTTSFRVELLQAVHNFGPTSADTFKIALFTGAADIGPNTTEYTPGMTGEVSGTGYVAGGNTLVISQSPTFGYGPFPNQIPTAYISFANTSWANASFTARGALIYNSSKSNKSVAVLDFGSDKTASSSPFTIAFPVDDASNAIVRVA